MYKNNARTHLESVLKHILPQGFSIKSSTLLQAYASFSALNSTTHIDDFNYNYRCICTANANYIFGYCSCFAVVDSDDFLNAKEEFLRFDLLSFLKFIVPDLAAQPEKLCDFYKHNFTNELIKFVHYMCQVRRVIFENLKNFPSETGGETKNELYNCYCNIEVPTVKRLSAEDFFKLYNYEILYPLSFPKTKILSGNKAYINNFITSVKSKLMLSSSEQIDLLHNIIFNDLETPEASVFYLPARFSKIKSGDKQHLEALNSCVISALKVSPFELLSELSITKRPQAGNRKTGSEGLKIRNDIPLTTGLI